MNPNHNPEFGSVDKVDKVTMATSITIMQKHGKVHGEVRKARCRAGCHPS